MGINVADLRRHPGHSEFFSFQQEMAPLSLGGETVAFAGPARVDVKVTGGRHVLVVEGTARATVRRECSRCLAPFEEEVTATLEEEYAHTSQVDFLDEAAREQVRVFGGEEIDLRDAVVEAIILVLPMRPVCQPECPGLCPRCGHDLNEGPCGCPGQEGDERLEVLRTLLSPRETR